MLLRMTHFMCGLAHIFVGFFVMLNARGQSTSSDIESNDNFGMAVALSGDFALVGAPSDDDGGSRAGSAYIFERVGEVWVQRAKLAASDAAAGNLFGSSVDLVGDVALIGAPGNSSEEAQAGSAYVFVRSGAAWVEQAQLLASDPVAADAFGVAVALQDGVAVIGAPETDDNGEGSGSAYVFERVGTTWSQVVKLLPQDGATNDEFGISVSLFGNTALIGADRDDDTGSSSGSAYIYERDLAGWSEQAKLNPEEEGDVFFFGSSVALWGDTALIGAERDDDAGNFTGSAFVFERVGNEWTQSAKILADDASGLSGFGTSVALEGRVAVIGAPQDDEALFNAGAAYVFDQLLDGTWEQRVKITADEVAPNDNLGDAVALSGDFAIFGAPGHSVGGSLFAERVPDFNDYASWAGQFFAEGDPNGAPGVDPDGDGFSNEEEFLALTDLEGDFEPLDVEPRLDGRFVDTRAVVRKRFYRVEISLPEGE